jgi:predicted ArsR family transcriptional regulator
MGKTHERSEDPDRRRHQALGVASRARILQALRASAAGLDARQAATRVSVHPNTARWHLERLVDAGLATRANEARARPGRPRVVFKATQPDEKTSLGGYGLLAEMLLAYLVQAAGAPADAAVRLGGAWGSYLVTDRPSPLETVPVKEALDRLLALLSGLGFDPEAAASAGGSSILLHRCPFRELAEKRSDVVCSIHLGLMRGVMAELRAPVEILALHPFVEPSLCRAELELIR